MFIRKTALVIAIAFSSITSSALAHGPRTPRCEDEPRAYQRSYDTIVEAFATFDAVTSPSTPGAAADVVLADWLDFMAPNVAFEAANAPALVGPLAVASYFAPLLPMMGTVNHVLDTVTPLCGVPNAWVVRGTLEVTRASDGAPIPAIRFTDTLFLNARGTSILRYEIRFDPAPIGLLFVP